MTIQEVQEGIIKEFKPFRNLLDKYAYLVKLGKNLPSMDSEIKTEKNLIVGCQLTTWFHSKHEEGKIIFDVDSSSVIIRGAISLLKRVLSDRTPIDVLEANLYFIERLGLQEIFSPIRANSLWKVENLMRQNAAACEKKFDIDKPILINS